MSSGSSGPDPTPGKRARRVKTPPIGAIRLLTSTLGRVSPSLAARFATRLFTTPPRYIPSEREASTLHSASSVAIICGDREIQVWSWGEGPAVLLVHGWGGRASQMTTFVPPLLAAGYRVVAFDGPAHGHSAGKRSSLPAFARAIEACDEVFGPFRAIVAHSMGTAATMMALRRGARAEAAVLFGPTSRPGEYLRHFAGLIALPDDAFLLMQKRIGARFQMSWEDLDMPRIASKFSIPAIIFHDRDDMDAKWADGKEISESWPGATLVTTEGLGHRRILRDPDIVRQAVDFIVKTA